MHPSLASRRPNPPTPPTDGLNPDQLDAVVHRGGPLLVVAGAGSGKTRVLTHRIAHLIHDGVHPSRILAITFTNKAADEMRQRVAALVGPVARTMWVSTFHSACVRILRANADRLGYPRQFSIYDQADAVRLTGYVIRDLHLDAKRFTPRGVHGLISLWKNELLGPADAAARAQNIFDRKHAEVYAEYQARLHKAGAMDFDDLLSNTVRLLRDHPDVLEHYRERFEHILVDEYQDTNQAQNEIVLLLAGGHHNVTVVGDTDQCLPAGTLVRTPTGDVPIESDRRRRRGPRRAGGDVRQRVRHRHLRPPFAHRPAAPYVVAFGEARSVEVPATPTTSCRRASSLSPARTSCISSYRATVAPSIGRTIWSGHRWSPRADQTSGRESVHEAAIWIVRSWAAYGCAERPAVHVADRRAGDDDEWLSVCTTDRYVRQRRR